MEASFVGNLAGQWTVHCVELWRRQWRILSPSAWCWSAGGGEGPVWSNQGGRGGSVGGDIALQRPVCRLQGMIKESPISAFSST